MGRLFAYDSVVRRTGLALGVVVLAALALVWRLSIPSEVGANGEVPRAAAVSPTPPAAVVERPAPLVPGEARVEGRVVCNHDVADLEGVQVDFEHDGQVRTVKTGRDGHFVFTTSESGDWNITAVRAETHRAPRTFDLNFDLKPGTVVEGVELRVDAMELRSGRVIDKQGKPVVGAWISQLFGLGEPGRSDENGEFTIDDLGPVSVSHRCCLDAHAWPPEDDAEAFVITLEPRALVPLVSFGGVVVDEDDRPVAGATVDGVAFSQFREAQQGFAGSRYPGAQDPFLVVSDAAGQFSVEIPAEASVSVGASLGGSSSARVEFYADARPRLKLLAHGSALSGRVSSRDGSPVGRFEVRFTSVEFDRSATFHSPDGTWRLPDLPAVDATVSVSAPGFLDARSERLTLARGEERAGVDFALERGLSLAGTVFDARTRRPIPGATIRANGHYGKMGNGHATSDPQGAFLLQGLRAGRIDLNADCLGYRDHEVTVEVGKQRTVRIDLAPGADSDSVRSSDYEGVGMRFDTSADPDAGQGYRVAELHPEGGARVAGVQVGDEVLTAGGVDATSVPTAEFLRQIKGAEGTVVTLTVRRGGQVFDLHAVRRRLQWAR